MIVSFTQIYGESVHLLQLGTSLVNQTVNHPEARQWLPQGVDKMIDLGAVVDNAYSYGKSGIASLVCTFVKTIVRKFTNTKLIYC